MGESRAVLRVIEAGQWARCVHCGERVKFQSAQKVKPRQVICNCYIDGRWDRTEHFHLQCYLDAGEPYGTADARKPMRV